MSAAAFPGGRRLSAACSAACSAVCSYLVPLWLTAGSGLCASSPATGCMRLAVLHQLLTAVCGCGWCRYDPRVRRHVLFTETKLK